MTAGVYTKSNTETDRKHTDEIVRNAFGEFQTSVS